MRSAGRLLELVVIPGSKHASRIALFIDLFDQTHFEEMEFFGRKKCLFPGGMMPEFGVWKLEREAWRVAINEYLVKN